MSCATHAQLARGEDVHDCVACRRARAEQRAIAALVAQVPAPALSTARRARLAAEVMAASDMRGMRPRRPLVRGVLAAAVLAAAGALLLVRGEGRLGPRLVVRESPVSVQHAPVPAPVEPAPAPAPVALEAPAVVPPALEDRGVPAPAPKHARQVFGATTGAQRSAIERETIEVTDTTAFRRGWEALRAGRHAEAIAAFDAATDPSVAEDAAFWSAVAAQRAGDLDDARKRLDSFLLRFPSSPRADDARRAREVLR